MFNILIIKSLGVLILLLIITKSSLNYKPPPKHEIVYVKEERNLNEDPAVRANIKYKYDKRRIDINVLTAPIEKPKQKKQPNPSGKHLNEDRFLESFVELKGGTFKVGHSDPNGVNFEHPQKVATVKPFRIMLYPVSIAMFANYMKLKPKYQTTAEVTGSSWVSNYLVDPQSLMDRRDHEDSDVIIE
jgi:formylglycine-generating enzyme required for sulfatase activity